MIRDARVLRDEFVPGEVQYREAEVDHLSSVLDPVTRGLTAETALLTGPTGVGKTCIARYTVDQLRAQFPDVRGQYVNCWRHHATYRTLQRILEGIDRAGGIHRQSTPMDRLVDRLREYEGPPCVLILDEADQLEDKQILYDLHDLHRFPLVLIANREEAVYASADDRLISRLRGSERIRFDGYDLDQLVAILSARAEWGLAPDAVDRETLEHIADEAAGNARYAISILRLAANHAVRTGSDRITVETAETVAEDAREEVRQKSISKLTRHQRVVYEIVTEAGSIRPGDLYERYRERVEDPRTDRTVRNYLQKMEQYNLVEATGTSHDRRYRAVNPDT